MVVEAEPRDGADKDPFIPKTVGTAAVIPASVQNVTELIGGCHGVTLGRPLRRSAARPRSISGEGGGWLCVLEAVQRGEEIKRNKTWLKHHRAAQSFGS